MRRAAIVLIALAFGAAAVPVVGAANAISGQTTCRDRNEAGIEPQSGDECFAGSTQRRAVAASLLLLSGGAAVLAMVAGGVAVLRDGRGFPFTFFAILSVALFFGAYGAARV